MKNRASLFKENRALKTRLSEADELLAAIKSGSVDAFVTDDREIFTLKSADHAYRVLVETINEGMATLKLDGTIMYCNRRLAAMLDRPMNACIGSSVFDFFGSDELQRLRLLFNQGGKKILRAEFRLKQGKGIFLPVLVSCNSLKNENASLCAVITDLTEPKKNELELEVKNRQLKQLADTLFRVEAEERKKFADHLHEDLQQILVACIMRLGMPNYSRKARSEINNLLVQAIESSRTLGAELRPPVLFEKGLVAGARWFIERNVKRLGLTVDIRINGYKESEDRNINAMLYQCVRELIFNIIKHAHVSRAVMIFATVKGESTIQVNDLGRGFIVFDAHSRKYGELGSSGFFNIGERLCSIGGKYEIKSNLGHGTKVTLTFPEQEKKLSLSADGGIVKNTPNQKANIKILVVDDHKFVREGIVNALSAEKYISVVGQAENGLEAVSKASELKPDIIVMDLNMPTLNGYEATRMLRNKKNKVKIIIISVNSDKQTQEAVLGVGANAFFSKSSDITELLKIIRRLQK